MTKKTIKEKVKDQFDHDFNYISLQLLEKAYPNGELREAIIYSDNYDFEAEQESFYPMWGTLFEAKSQWFGEILIDKVNELAKIGIYLMQVDETNAMIFICGAGYSFYDHHWIPLYRDVLKYVS